MLGIWNFMSLIAHIFIDTVQHKSINSSMFEKTSLHNEIYAIPYCYSGLN